MDALRVINSIHPPDPGQVYYRYELKNVLVTSYSISGAGQ